MVWIKLCGCPTIARWLDSGELNKNMNTEEKLRHIIFEVLANHLDYKYIPEIGFVYITKSSLLQISEDITTACLKQKCIK